MNALMEPPGALPAVKAAAPVAPRQSHPGKRPARSPLVWPAPLNWRRCAFALLASVSVHASLVLLLSHRPVTFQPAEYGLEAADSSVEETLLAALPSQELTLESLEMPEPELAPTPPLVPPEPTPPPEDEPLPPPDPREMDFVEPTPAPRAPERTLPKPAPAAVKPKPSAPTVARVAGDGSSPQPGRDATTLTARAGASSKPTYLRNPAPPYPPGARAAGQQGVVRLRVKINAEGRPASVRVEQTSGSPLLDDSARSTVSERWLFKPPQINGVAVATELVIPVRFDLKKG